MTRDQALALIAKERVRQVEAEGWTSEHDDGHADGSLLRVATLYFQNSGASKYQGESIPPALDEHGVPVGFPWYPQFWKPKTPLRDLVRAAALCIAERERLLRKNPKHYVGNADHKFELIVTALMVLEAPSIL